MADASSAIDFWFWPLRVGLGLANRAAQPASEVAWTTPNRIVAETPTMRLRLFSPAPTPRRSAKPPRDRTPILIVAPFAVHDAGIADLAPGHSLIEKLRARNLGPIALTEWKSADAAMAGASIDSYLADLNVAVDLVGGAPDLIGLCQGGWMTLLYAAAFPRKARRLVVVGAPVDTSYPSPIASSTQLVTAEMLERIIAVSGGLVPGAATLSVFQASGTAESNVCEILQIAAPAPPGLAALYAAWDARAVTLPGRYYADVANWLFRENRLAKGAFPAFGRATPLSRVTAPLYLLAGAHDTIAPAAQVMAAAALVGTARSDIVRAEADCSHLSLFLGAKTLATQWRDIGDWLAA